MNLDINMNNHLMLNIPDMILVLVSTIILVIVAKKYFWTYLTDYLNKRQEIISKELSEAKEKHEESTKILNEYKERLSSAQKETTEIILDAKKRGEAMSAEIVSRGHKDAEHLMIKAKEQIEKEKSDAKKEIQAEIVSVALATAEKFLEENLSEDKHQKMIEDFVGEFEVSTWKE